MAGSSSCYSCIPGQRYDSSSVAVNKCADCGVDEYNVNGDGASCTDCAANSYSNTGSSSCYTCAPGYEYYSTMPVSVDHPQKCAQCPISEYSATGVSCEVCAASSGYVQHVAGSASCDYCGLGTFADVSTNTCENCSASKYSAGGSDSCTPCGNGGHSEAGSSSCISTPPGHYWSGLHDLPCPAGTFSETGDSCLPCSETGSYSSPGASFCLLSPAGSRSKTDRTGTHICGAGSFSGIGQDSCTLCEIGKFTLLEQGSDFCSFCDADDAVIGSTTLSQGSSSVDSCICAVDQFKLEFEPNKFKCEKNVDAGICSISGTDECLNENATGTTIESIWLQPGFWRVSNISLIVRKCSNPDYCLGGQKTSQSCKENHVGPFCQKCAGEDSNGTAYAMGIDGCEACLSDDLSSTIAAFLLFCLVTILLLHQLLVKAKFELEEDTLEKTVQFSKKLWRTMLKALEALKQFKVQLKIILAYSQIATAMQLNYSIQFPVLFSTILKYVYGVFNVDLFWLGTFTLNFVNIGCFIDLHYWRRTASSAYLLIGVMAGMLSYYRFLNTKSNSDISMKKASNKVVACMDGMIPAGMSDGDKRVTAFRSNRLTEGNLKGYEAENLENFLQKMKSEAMGRTEKRGSILAAIANQGLSLSKLNRVNVEEEETKLSKLTRMLFTLLCENPLYRFLARTLKIREKSAIDAIMALQKERSYKVGARVEVLVGKKKQQQFGTIVYPAVKLNRKEPSRVNFEVDEAVGFPYAIELDDDKKKKLLFLYSKSSFTVLSADQEELDDGRSKLAVKVFGNFLFLSFLIFPTTITQLAYMMGCEAFHDEANDDYCVDEDNDGVFECGKSKDLYDSIGSGSEGYYLRSDYTLKCFESNYYWFMAVALVAIAVYTAVPLGYFVMLYRVRHKLDPGQGERAKRASLDEDEKYIRATTKLTLFSFFWARSPPPCSIKNAQNLTKMPWFRHKLCRSGKSFST